MLYRSVSVATEITLFSLVLNRPVWVFQTGCDKLCIGVLTGFTQLLTCSV